MRHRRAFAIARPRSLRARLVVSAAVFVLVAIVVVGIALSSILDGVVRREIVNRLDLQISTIRAELPAPLRLDRSRAAPRGEDHVRRLPEGGRLNGPPFDRPGSGWYWQVDDGEDAVLARSRSLGGESLAIEEADRRRPRGGGPPAQRFEAIEGPGGQRLLLRRAELEIGGRSHRIVATAPESALYGPLRAAMTTVGLVLVLLGASLVAAILVQVRFGLAPMEALRRQLAAVRAGDAASIEGPQPRELAPLVGELNALIEQDAVNLRQARLHVANLAHGLKTPLASLSAMVERRPDDAGRREILGLTELMDRRIRHHLRRAQTAALGGSARRRSDLAVHVADLANMVRKFRAGSPVVVRTQGPDELGVAVDGEDLDEMLGNLVDNALRHARTQVSIAYGRIERDVVVRIADDGAGLSDADAAVVRQAGRRLDETTPGHGFGLPITIEIAELYGGRLELGRAAMGGLEARLVLPTAEWTPAR